MKTKICLLTGVLALTAIPNLFPNTAFAQARVVVVEPATLLPTLQQAYVTLSSANHDYQGHRAPAMKEIAAAAALLGRDVTGDGRGREPQTLSDLQIRSVQMSLLTVGRSNPSGVRQTDLARHINAAVRELSLALIAETDPKAPKPAGKVEVVAVENAVTTNAVEVSSLQRIYEVLAQANHDYKGHRAAAMERIAKASKALGGPITGDGRGKENQATSDEQLQQAQTLLVQVRDSFTANDPKKVLNEMNGAVSELSTALSIK